MDAFACDSVAECERLHTFSSTIDGDCLQGRPVLAREPPCVWLLLFLKNGIDR